MRRLELHVRQLLPRNLGEEGVVLHVGRLNCPSCHAAVRPVGDRGCNRIKCMSDAHGSSFFYFCFWCKGEIKGDAYCTNEGCPERIDMSTRRSKQKLQNREARDNPISIDSDSD